MCVCCNSGRKLLNPRLSLIQYKFFVVVVFFFFLGLLVLCCLPICREYLQQQLSPLRHINFAEPEQKRNIRRVKISHFSSSYVETTQNSRYYYLLFFAKQQKFCLRINVWNQNTILTQKKFHTLLLSSMQDFLRTCFPFCFTIMIT